jgi:hypothetical protein
MEAAERSLLQSTVDAALADAGTSAGSATVAAVDEALARLGWREMLRAEPRDAIEIVFGALGRANATATVLDDVLATALGVEPRDDLAVLLPRFAAWDAPGRLERGAVHVDGLATARAATADDLLVVCSDGADLRTVVLPLSQADVEPVRGVDPDGGLHAIRITSDAGDATPLDPATWEATIAVGRRAIARQIAGADRAMLELARTHAVERVQFGRPIAGFQAVRHRLADSLVAVEALDATVSAAWDEPNAETAALAKAVVGRTTRTVTAHCQQVLAGIGFTTDHPFHRFLKRTMALDGLFGSADEIVLDLGRRLLATRRVPTLIEL